MGESTRPSVAEVINQHRVLVSKVARFMAGKLPSSVQLDDLIQSGLMGLIDAWKNFDPQRGVAFESFAMARIKGAMLDDLRKSDWVPRSVYYETRQVKEAIQKLEQQKQGPVHDHEVAHELSLSLSEYQELLAHINYRVLLSTDELSELYGEDSSSSALLNENGNPENQAESIDFNAYLSELIQHLSFQEKTVLKLYYDDDLNLKEISDILGVSESRVSQIHSQAVKILKTHLSGYNQTG